MQKEQKRESFRGYFLRFLPLFAAIPHSPMTTAAAKPPERSPDLRQLQSRLRAVRGKRTGSRVATGLAMTLTAMLTLLGGEMLLDWLIELSWTWRLVALLPTLGSAGFIAWRYAIAPARQRLDDDAAALLIEQSLPTFRGRFIAAIQLSREVHDQRAAGLIRALTAETVAMAAGLDFRSVVKLDRLKRWAGLAFAVFAVAVGLFVFGGAASPILLRRAFLSTEAVPRKTQIVAVTGDQNIGTGESLSIDATVAGIIPSEGKLIIQTKSGKPQEFAFQADPAKPRGAFTRSLSSIQEPFSYSVHLGDATSATFHVATWPAPAVVSIDCLQVFPAYTKIQPAHRHMSDLRILAGSQLKLKIKATSQIKSAAAVLTGADAKTPQQTTPLQIDAKDPTLLTGTVPIPAKNVTGLSLQLVNEHNVVSRESAVYPIELIEDRPPTVRLTYPMRTQSLVTTTGGLLIGFEASDDFGISHVYLHYTTDTANQTATRTVELDAGPNNPANLSRRFEWKIGSLVPRQPVGANLDYWIEVLDANDLSGPNAASTEHYQVKVVTPEEKRADLANRLMNSMGTLNELDTQQRQINENLGPVIFEKPAP